MRILLLAICAMLCFQCTEEKKAKSNESSTFEKMSTELSQAWVNENLDSVMIPLTFSASNGMNLPYRLFVSPQYDGIASLPLLIHLHGRGERGTDNTPKVYNNIPLFTGANAIVSPNMQNDFPCIVLVPQCSDKTINEEWAKWAGNTPETPFEGLGKDGSYAMAEKPSESAAAALELIDKIIAEYNIDQSRVYLTGLSMGGFGTWEFIGRRPEFFAAAVPMAGYSDPSIVDKVKHMPIWIFHGNVDIYNPVEGSRNMFKLLTDAGGNVKYTELDGFEHSPAFKEAWKDSTLLPWIFAQHKK